MVKRIQILLLSLLATGASHAASAQIDSGAFEGAFIDPSLEISAEPEAAVQEGNVLPERIISVRRFIALNTSAIKNKPYAQDELLEIYREGFQLRCGNTVWDPVNTGFATCFDALTEIVSQHNEPSIKSIEGTRGFSGHTLVSEAPFDAAQLELDEVDKTAVLWWWDLLKSTLSAGSTFVSGGDEEEDDWIPGGTGISPGDGFQLALYSKLSTDFILIEGEAVRQDDGMVYIPKRLKLTPPNGSPCEVYQGAAEVHCNLGQPGSH